MFASKTLLLSFLFGNRNERSKVLEAKEKPIEIRKVMVYILNTNLNQKKKLFLALTEVYGLGRHTSSQLCDVLGVSGDRRLKQLSSKQIEYLIQLVNQNYSLAAEIKRSRMKNIQRLIKIASYRGFRHTEGLPVRGQRTHGNSRTRKKLKQVFLSS